MREVDGGSETFNLGKQTQATDARLTDTTVEMETAVCDLDVTMNERLAEIEMTLCEMDMMYNGEGA